MEELASNTRSTFSAGGIHSADHNASCCWVYRNKLLLKSTIGVPSLSPPTPPPLCFFVSAHISLHPSYVSLTKRPQQIRVFREY